MAQQTTATATEKADAADEVVRMIEAAHAALWEARKRIRVLHDDKHCLGLVDKDMTAWLDRCDDPLWAARKIAVVEAYDQRRKADIETGGPHAAG